MTEVDRSPPPTPTKASFVSTNDDCGVNKNSKVDFKILYTRLSLKYDAVTCEMHRVSIECKVFISVKGRVLVQASKLIKVAVYKSFFVELKVLRCDCVI